VKLCAEVLRFGWVLFHHIGPGAWWTAGKLRALPAPPLPRCPAGVSDPFGWGVFE